MIALTLPTQARRVQVRSFCLSLGVLAAATSIAVGWWLRAPTAAPIGAATALVVALVLARQEEASFRLYRAWNRRLVRPFSALATQLILRVCFFVVTVAAFAGGRRRSASGAWVPRGTLPPEAYSMPFAVGGTGHRPRAWMAGYVAWAYRTGNLWSVALLPFLMLLSVLPAGGDDALPANIYTLF